ncbi:MAG: hypothetical protein QM490_01150 [Candidatus Gracilibacteria bacterium]
MADQPQRVRSQINLINSLLNQGINNIVFIIACQIKEDELLRIEKIKKIFLVKQLNAKNSTQLIQNKNKSLLKYFVKNTSIGQLVYMFLLSIKMFNLLKIANKIIKNEKPNILFVNGDRGGVSFEQSFLIAAIKNNVKSVVPYTSTISNGLSLRFADISNYSKKTFLDLLVFKFFSNITKRVKNKTILFYDASTTLILFFFGSLSKNPWMIGNGLADYVCIDNQMSFNKYCNEMIYEGKFKIMGDIEYDTLYQISKATDKKIFHKYNIMTDKEVVIIALPQLAEHFILGWDEHWSEIYYIMDVVEALNVNVLISLHPKMDLSKYTHLESKYKCKILDEQLKDVINHADLFIAVNSSTVLWSVILGIKTIVLDYFNVDSNFFKEFTSIEFVSDKNKLLEVAQKILEQDIDFTHDFELMSKNEIFDGKTTQRYIKLIQEATK